MRIKLIVLITLGFITFVTGGYTCPFTDLKLVGESGSNITNLAAPTNLVARAVTKSRIDLSWADNSSNEFGFKVERRGQGEEVFFQVGTTGPSITKFSNTGVTAQGTYEYRILAYNIDGDSLPSNVSSSSNAPPSDPTNLAATPKSYTEVQLTWTDNSINETGFKIERSTDGFSFTMIKVVGASITTYSDTGLVPNTSYYYRVKGYSNLFGDSGYTSVVSASTFSTSDMVRTWGGTTIDRSNDLYLDPGANVYVTGKTKSFGVGNDDAFVLKYNSGGDVLWQRTWGESSNDEATAVGADSDGNVYIAGTTYSFDVRGSGTFLVQYDASGSVLWQKKWDGIMNDFIRGIGTSSGGIYLAGETNSNDIASRDTLAVKYNAGGSVQWAKSWGTSGTDSAYGIAVDSSDNIYICGETATMSGTDCVLLKYSGFGSLQWSKDWSHTGTERGRAVVVTSGGSSIYVVGQTNSDGAGNDDALILKYGSNGALIWEKTWGGINSDIAYGVAVDDTGTIYVTGMTSSFGASGAAFLLKYDSSGFIVEQKIWDGPAPDSGASVSADAYCIFVAGYTQNLATAGGWQDVIGTDSFIVGSLDQAGTGAETVLSAGIEQGGITGRTTTPTGSVSGGGGDDALLLRMRK